MNISLNGFYKSLFGENQIALYSEGLKNTLLISLFATLIGIVIGLFIALIKYQYQEQKSDSELSLSLIVLNKLANFYTTVIRGTPVLLQLLILYATAFKGGFSAAIIGFGINSGAYVSEIVRAGLNSVDKGQAEAARSLGLSTNETLRHIIIPQAFKNIVPALFNEFISLIKETSVAGSIAVIDITKVGQRFQSKTYLIEPLFIVAIIYLFVVLTLTKVQQLVERRLAVSDRS